MTGLGDGASGVMGQKDGGGFRCGEVCPGKREITPGGSETEYAQMLQQDFTADQD